VVDSLTFSHLLFVIDSLTVLDVLLGIDLLTVPDPLFVIEDSRQKRQKVNGGRQTKRNELSEFESH
jgi:hypothetical protein